MRELNEKFIWREPEIFYYIPPVPIYHSLTKDERRGVEKGLLCSLGIHKNEDFFIKIQSHEETGMTMGYNGSKCSKCGKVSY